MANTKLPSTFYNLLSLIGAALALFGAAAMLILYVLDAFGTQNNPYLGIFIFVIFPGLLLLGLILIPVGMRIENRRRQRGQTAPIVVDLGKTSHRNALVVFVVGTSIFLLLTTLGLYGGYEYTESVEFCGEVCHKVMEPEFVAFQNSAHAKVECVHCHIGNGVDWYVKSKLSGARQVFKTALNTYPRPIETPIVNLRPAREICEECHWPGKFFASKEEVWDYYMSDEANSHYQLRVLMHIGGDAGHGEPTGSHWHVSADNHMTYVAKDGEREEFEQVTWYANGEPVVYSKNGKALPDSVMAQKEADGLVRVMDCIDCHTRPAHNYRSPLHTVNDAMSNGQIDPSIPWIKRAAVMALSQEYFTSEGARDSIRTGISEYYEEKGLEAPEEAIEVVQDIYENNYFPHMRVRWDRYPDHIGHMIFTGCFRCHGSELETADGRTIPNDCNTCHTIIAQGFTPLTENTIALGGLDFVHPVDIDGAEREMPCTDCHVGDDSNFPDEADAGDLQKAEVLEED